jgi:hypothetical protein
MSELTLGEIGQRRLRLSQFGRVIEASP